MAVVDYFLKIDASKVRAKPMDTRTRFSWNRGRLARRRRHVRLRWRGGAGKVSFNDFHFVMKVNKSTPDLFIDCCIGKHIPSALLTCRKAAGKQETLSPGSSLTC